ncbi:MAG: LVIVD repeat-containing protein [Candidatus Hydrothermia bacterium]
MKRTKIFLLILLASTSCIKPQGEYAQYKVVGRCGLPGYPKGIDFYQNYALIADDQAGLQILDISDPQNPNIVGSYISNTRFVDVAVRDTFAYIASLDRGGLKILSIKDPGNPMELGNDPSFSAYKIYVPDFDSSIIFIAAGYWLHLQSVQDPVFTSYIKRWAVPGNARSVFGLDTLAFIASEQMGVYVYNIRAPSQSLEAQVGHIDTPGNARDIFVNGNYAYVADGLKGLIIIDISNPESLKIVSSYDTRGYAQGVWVENNLCYIADREGGLVVIDVTDPQKPVLHGIYNAPYTYNVKTRDGLIYLLDRDNGLLILEEIKE